MAELIPHLALFISLIGAFASTALALIYPPIIELLCLYFQESLSLKAGVKNILLLLFGALGIVTGLKLGLVMLHPTVLFSAKLCLRQASKGRLLTLKFCNCASVTTVIWKKSCTTGTNVRKKWRAVFVVCDLAV